MSQADRVSMNAFCFCLGSEVGIRLDLNGLCSISRSRTACSKNWRAQAQRLRTSPTRTADGHLKAVRGKPLTNCQDWPARGKGPRLTRVGVFTAVRNGESLARCGMGHWVASKEPQSDSWLLACRLLRRDVPTNYVRCLQYQRPLVV